MFNDWVIRDKRRFLTCNGFIVTEKHDQRSGGAKRGKENANKKGKEKSEGQVLGYKRKFSSRSSNLHYFTVI
jgi:ribosomal protein L19E